MKVPDVSIAYNVETDKHCLVNLKKQKGFIEIKIFEKKKCKYK